MRLEPENSSGNSGVDLTEKKSDRKIKIKKKKTSPKQPSSSRSLVPAL